MTTEMEHGFWPGVRGLIRLPEPLTRRLEAVYELAQWPHVNSCRTIITRRAVLDKTPAVDVEAPGAHGPFLSAVQQCVSITVFVPRLALCRTGAVDFNP
jgi:hypothetical protein